MDVWPREAIGGWLHGVATRVALKARAQRTHRQARETELGGGVEAQTSADGDPDCDVAELIHRAIAKLPEVYRAAVIACDLEGLSRQAAAARLGWKEGTLSGRLSRARNLLARRLRRSGLVAPSAGLAAVLGAKAPVRAGLIDRVLKLVHSSAEIATPLASLTHGVVPNMLAFKLKAAVAATMVACIVGFGAWSAGAGEEPGRSAGPVPAPPLPVPLPEPNLNRLRDELKKIEQDLAALAEEGRAAGKNPSESLRQRIQHAETKLGELRQFLAESRVQTGKADDVRTPKLEPALAALQGQWKIETSIDGAAAPVDVQRELIVEIQGNILKMPYQESTGAIKQEEYRIAVDARRTPAAIDFIKPGKPVGHGIFEFTASSQTCLFCHVAPLPGAKSSDPHVGFESCATCHKNGFNQARPSDRHGFITCLPGARFATGLRLALALNGSRPTKFGGGEGVIEFRLKRIGGGNAAFSQDLKDWLVPHNGLVRDDPNVNLIQAQADEQHALGELQQSQVQLNQAEAVVELAKVKLQQARLRLAEARKAADAKNPPQPVSPKPAEFTIHVRTLLAAEKVIPMTAGSHTVLDAFASAFKDAPVSVSDVSSWIVRNGKVMPVNLAGIVEKGNTTTNYVLLPGDRLFIQQKPGG
jgi:uncharacterized protein (TIGR03067 family)